MSESIHCRLWVSLSTLAARKPKRHKRKETNIFIRPTQVKLRELRANFRGERSPADPTRLLLCGDVSISHIALPSSEFSSEWGRKFV